jgi:hypothetical protein
MMPPVPKKDESGAIRFEASRYIPFKITDSVLDYHTRLVHKNVCSVTVTAIRREVVAACLETLRAASAKALMIEPAYCAVSRVIEALNVTSKSKAQGFVVLQSDGNVNVTLASQGVVYLSRDFHLSGEVDEDQKRFHEEIAASIDYFYKLTGGASMEHIFVTGSGNLRGWVEYLEHAFNYTVRFDIPGLPGAKDVSQETLDAICVAFGLALRGLNYRSPLGDIRLLPKVHRRSGLREMLAFLGFQSLCIFALFLFVRLFAFQPNLTELNRQHDNMVETFHREYPAFSSKTTQVLMSQQEALGVKASQLRGIYSDQVLFSSILTAIGQGLPDAILLDDISLGLKEDSGKMKTTQERLRLSAGGVCYLGGGEKETAVISGWVKSLAAKKPIAQYFSEIKVAEIRREKTGNRELTRFRIASE